MNFLSYGFIFYSLILWFFTLGCNKTTTSYHENSDSPQFCINAQLVPSSESTFYDSGFLTNLAEKKRYMVSLKQSEWVNLAAYGDKDEDYVLSVYSQEGILLATVDDSFITQSIDPDFMYHVSKDGDYCIVLETVQSWIGYFGEGTSNIYSYNFFLNKNPQEAQLYSTQENTNFNAALELSFETLPNLSFETLDDDLYLFVNGFIEAQENEHFYKFATGSQDKLIWIIRDMALGTGMGNQYRSGSGTTLFSQITLFDAEMNKIASLDLNSELYALLAEIKPLSEYYFSIKGSSLWTPGENDFYSLFLYLTDSSQFYFEPVSDNSSFEKASLVPTKKEQGLYVSTFMGNMNDSEDVDVFFLNHPVDNIIYAECSGANLGSGIKDLTIRILDSQGQLVATEVETSGIPLEIFIDTQQELDKKFDFYYIEVSAFDVDASKSRLYTCSIYSF